MAKETHIKTDKNPLSAGVLGSYLFLNPLSYLHDNSGPASDFWITSWIAPDEPTVKGILEDFAINRSNIRRLSEQSDFFFVSSRSLLKKLAN